MIETSLRKNAVISPNFLVWKFCGKAQFPLSFRRLAQNYVETMSVHKISTTGNYVKLLHFTQCISLPFSSRDSPIVNKDAVTVLTPVDTKVKVLYNCSAIRQA